MSPCNRLPCLPSSSRPTGTPLPPPRPIRDLSTHALHQSASRATLRGAQPEPQRIEPKTSLFSKIAKSEDKKDAKDKDKKSKRDSSTTSGNGADNNGAEAEGESLFADPELVKYLFNPAGRLIPMAAPVRDAGDVPGGGKRRSGAGYIALPVYHAEPAADEEKANAEKAAVEKNNSNDDAATAPEKFNAEKTEASPTVRLVPKSERDAASVMSGSMAVAEVDGGEKGAKAKKVKKPSAWDTMGVIFT